MREEERITIHKKGKKDGREGVKILLCFERPICNLVYIYILLANTLRRGI